MSEEFTQVVVIIIVLLGLYLGLNFWIKRGGSLSLPSFRSSGKTDAAPDNHLPGGDTSTVDQAIRSKSGNRSSAVERHGERFNLTGKDAEIAARVLKRMLKKDKDPNEKP